MDQTSIAMSEGANITNEQVVILHRKTGFDKKQIYYITKRLSDIVLSLIGLIISSPIFLLVAVLIKADSTGPIIYKHKRIGKNNKTLYIYKFRSMVTNSDEIFKNFSLEQKNEFLKNFKLDNDPRITRIGKLIRKTSIDELPQLINILKGDLSLVGPRPVVNDEIVRYGTNSSLFLSVKPGLTGYWQAHGRSAISYEERMQMEMYYIKNASLLFDIKIMLSTVVAVIKKKGAE